MSKAGHMPNSDLPWSFPVLVTQLPEAGLHQVLEATPAQRGLLAAVAGVNAVLQAVATFDVHPEAGGIVSVTGTVKARVEQTCVVSLDPVENDIEEAIAAVFAPPSQIAVSPKSVQKEQGEDAEIPNPPEPIVHGAIDLGQLAAEFLVLGIDPYPRKPGVAFAPPEIPEDPDEHPFAALKALKEKPGASGGKKPKGK
ncbi:MAG: DUF177 domain-containing protein [Pseudomonadota bacterium]